MSEEEKADELQIKHLKERIVKNLGGFDGNAWFNNRRAFVLKILGLIFGSLTTVLIGVSQKGVLGDYGGCFSIGALVASAVVSGLAAWEAFFSYRERWLSYTESAQKLRRVRDELDFLTAGGAGITKAQLTEFFQRFQVILQEANTGWLNKKEGGDKPG